MEGGINIHETIPHLNSRAALGPRNSSVTISSPQHPECPGVTTLPKFAFPFLPGLLAP